MKTGKMAIISFSSKGECLAEKIKYILKEPLQGCQWSVECTRKPDNIKTWCKEQFETKDAIIFIGAIGIAVRKIAPYIVHKTIDPAVLVIDDLGIHIIPILSGHLGGGNALANALSGPLGAEPVITTASDINGKIAIDVFAKENQLHISNMKMATKVATSIVDDEPVSLECTGQIRGDIPKELSASVQESQSHVVISPNKPEMLGNTLWLIPKAYILGVGCKKGKSMEDIEQAIKDVLNEHGISIYSVSTLASIDIKQEEKGLLEFCDKYNLSARFYSAEELLHAPGTYEVSAFVQSVTGVDNICERAAMCRAKEENPDIEKETALIIEKTKKAGVTVALAKRKWGITFG